MARVSGNRGSFSWSKGSSTVDFTTMEGFFYDGEIGSHVDDTTPLGYGGDRIEGFGQYGRGRLGFLTLAGTLPPIPDGVIGTLTLTQESGKTRVFKALIHKLSIQPITARRPQAQRVVYEWVMSSDSSSVQLSNS